MTNAAKSPCPYCRKEINVSAGRFSRHYLPATVYGRRPICPAAGRHEGSDVETVLATTESFESYLSRNAHS